MAAKKTTAPKSAEQKQYETFGGILTAKSRQTLPRGTKAKIHSGGAIKFIDGKGNQIASINLDTFAEGELKRHGFRVVD